MSKAFVKEPDSEADLPYEPPPAPRPAPGKFALHNAARSPPPAPAGFRARALGDAGAVGGDAPDDLLGFDIDDTATGQRRNAWHSLRLRCPARISI
jgi:hypothetical protein